MIGKSAGSRPGSREKQSRYSIIDSCDKCTLGKYIELVCNDDLKVLILSGDPPAEVLEAARIKIISDFSMACGSMNQNLSITRMIYYYHSLILLYATCADLISLGVLEDPVSMLNKNGIRCSTPASYEEVIKLVEKINLAISEKKIRLKTEMKKLNSSLDKKEEKPTRENFISSLVALSKHVGFRLTTEISLTEYAGYLKDYKQEVERLKQVKNGKNN